MLTSERAVQRVRDAGLRLTPQRRVVIDVLVGDTSHPRAEDVADEVSRRMPGVSLSTVYKTLHEFAGIGLVRELEGAGPMRFDPDSGDHAHMVCEGCGSVTDLEIPSSVAKELASAARGAEVDHIDITVHATCPSCAG